MELKREEQREQGERKANGVREILLLVSKAKSRHKSNGVNEISSGTREIQLST